MQDIITLKVLSAVSENGFSLDELVFQTRELFNKEGLSGFVGLILRLTDERVCMQMVQGKSVHGQPACCSELRYEYQGSLSRQFRTSVGTVMIQWRRLRCCNCGHTNIPLRDFLGLDRYQSKTSELEKMVTEIVSEQSYQAQIAETCNPENQAQLITSVIPQTAAESDADAVEEVLNDLTANDLMPDELLVDTAYAGDNNVQLAEENGVELVGPVAGCSTQDDEQLTIDDFNIDDKSEEVACCPTGHKPESSEQNSRRY